MVTVEQLYKDFGVLADAKDKASEHEAEYKRILDGVKGGPGEKRLASQFITRFFKYFPALVDEALDAQFDLCEDDDVNIRKQAVKDLLLLCRDSPDHLMRVAEVMVQLLQTDDASEQSHVQTSLLGLLKKNPKGVLSGVFGQILQGEEIVREPAIKFLSSKLSMLTEDILTKEIEEYVLEECKKVLVDVTGDEFVNIMKLLSGLTIMGTLKGRKQLVDIVTDQADLEKPFEAANPDNADRLIHCIREVMPLLSKNVHSTAYVAYMCNSVLPVLSDIVPSDEEMADGAVPDVQLDLLKLLAELSSYCGVLEEPEKYVQCVFNKLLDYMPVPPVDENVENTNGTEEPKLQFSHVECLMYTFHQLGPKTPEILTAPEHAERLKDFRLRLQYFARGVQLYIKQLRVALQGKTGDALKTDESKIKVAALKITNNINILIKDLFHNPPSYKATVTLSFRPVAKSQAKVISPSSAGQKRPGITPITYEGEQAAKKASRGGATGPRKLYAPPSGKFSDKAGKFSDDSETFTSQGEGRGRGRGRGYGRGYGRGRGRGFRRW